MQQPLIMSNAQDAYRRQHILTASPLELIIMLYDGLKKDILLAKKAINKNDMASAHKHLIRGQEIICELINCLDLNIEMSKDLMDIYEFLLHSLEEINLSKNIELMAPILEIIETLRDTWQQVHEMQKSGASHPPLDEVIG